MADVRGPSMQSGLLVSARSVRVSMWVLVALFGLRFLTDILIIPLVGGLRLTIADAWWRLLVVGLIFLTFMILWNAYRTAQRWSWIALLVTVVLFFGGSAAIHAWLGDRLWLIINGVGLVGALIALAASFKEFFGS